MSKMQTEPDCDLKVLALCIIQFFGAMITFGMHAFSKLLQFYTMQPSMYWLLFILLALLLSLSLYVGVRRPASKKFIRNILRSLENTIPDCEVEKTTRKNAARIVRLFAAADLLVVGISVINTGGSEISIFSPFLFIVVPMIVIIKITNWKEILVFAIASFVIYVTSLFPEIYLHIFPSAFLHKYTGHIKHDILLSISTFVCSSFPISFIIMEHKYKHSNHSVSGEPPLPPPNTVSSAI